MHSVENSHKLGELRKLMSLRGIKAYFVPSEDAHQSEYIAKCDGRREYISGFSGSAGFAIITDKEAALWTDGRYFLQAEKQLDCNWKLMKAGVTGTPLKEDFLANSLNPGDLVGVDPQTISYTAAVKLSEALLEKNKIKLKFLDENLIDSIWMDRPKRLHNPIFLLDSKYSGRSMSEKLGLVRESLKKDGFEYFLVTALDEVAWLFNLRGSDISCNPCFFSYALIHKEDKSKTFIYLDESQLTTEARNELKENGVGVKEYSAIFPDLKQLKQEYGIRSDVLKTLISGTCNAALVECIGDSNIVNKKSPIEMEKALKNSVEIEGMRKCHLRDAAALIKYFAWLEKELKEGKVIDEVDGADQLEKFRQVNEHFKGLSFDTISGAGPNGAIIHYKPEKGSSNIRQVTLNELYLCDSGAQYLDGTTDVTRTIHMGTPTAEEKECFTRVLLGHIAVDRIIFPAGTTGFMLDILARQYLWQRGLDYRHGTGHGVGHFLNVHEGPQSISFHPRSNETALKPGMTITNEPGFYLDGKFGIRIENVLIVKEASFSNPFGGMEFYKFENLTMVPIQTKLMDTSLMSEEDIEWVNEHHGRCWELVSPLLGDDQLALQWLRRETAPISKQ